MSKEKSGCNWAAAFSLGALAALVLAFMPLGFEPWVHLAMGRTADTFGTIPDRNIFVYTLDAAKEMAILGWLGQWWLYKVHQLLDWHGVLALRGLIAFLAVVICALSSRTGKERVGQLALGVLALVLTIPIGPALFGGLLLLLVLVLLRPVFFGEAKKRAFLVPLLMPLMVHVDGVFALVVLLTIGWAIEARTRNAAALAILTSAATFVNPRGFEVWLLAFEQFTLPGLSATLLGLLAFWLWKDGSRGWPWALIAVFVAFRPELIGFGMLAMMMMLKPAEQTAIKIPKIALAAILTVSLLAQPLWAWWSPITELVGIGRHSERDFGAISKKVPLDAVRIIQSWGSRACVLHPPELAGVLMFELGKEPYPMLFTGPEAVPDLVNANIYGLVREDTTVALGLVHQFSIKAALIPAADIGLGKFLVDEMRFQKVHEDGAYVLYGR